MFQYFGSKEWWIECMTAWIQKHNRSGNFKIKFRFGNLKGRTTKKNNLKVEHNIKTRSGFLQSCSLSPTVAKWAKSEIISYRELHKTSAESKIRKYGFFTQPSDTTTEAIFEQLILFLSHFIFTILIFLSAFCRLNQNSSTIREFQLNEKV